MGKSRSKDLAINTVIIGIGKFSTQLVSFLLLPLYTSILTTTEYGNYDLIITISTFLLPLITLLMEESMFRFLIDCKDDEQKKQVISQTSIYSFFSSIVFIALVFLISRFVNIPYVLIGTIYIISSIISGMRNAIVRGLGKLKVYAFINFFASLINILCNILFIAVWRYGLYGLFFAGVISNIISSISIFIKFKIFKYISFKNYDKKLMGEMVKYSVPLVPNSLSWAIVNVSDRLVISGFLGTGANGIYSMSYKFPNLMNTIYGFFYTSWKESSAKVIKDDDKEVFFNKIYNVLHSLMFSVCIGMIACLPIVFNIFIKKAYNESYLYIPILVLSMYFNNMAGYYGGIFSAYKNTKIMGKTTVIGAVINLVVNVVLVKFIGIYAAAISTLLSCMYIYYIRKIKIKSYINIKYSNNIIGILILTLSLVLYYINDNIWIKLLNLLIVIIFAIFQNKELVLKCFKTMIDKIKK